MPKPNASITPLPLHPASVYQTHLLNPAGMKKHNIRPIRKLLVANRSEIAIRVFRTCNEMGITTVGIYSNEDKLALHRYKCDEAYLVGNDKGPVQAYLQMDEIIQLALDKGCDAIHPGYGFMSENREFAGKVIKAGLIWVGPDPEVMDKVSDKVAARTLAIKLGIPVIPGTKGPVKSVEEAVAFAAKAGYPVMVKAAAGGGGRGIRIVNNEKEMKELLPLAQQEALKFFGDDACFIEKRVMQPKHLEVQILGDRHGNVMHLFERDCSIQRRHQKVIEIAPSLALSEERRQELCQRAVKFAKAAGYQNAGTVEFLMDRSGEIYLIEMNTRIQVEHTVTEMVTGVDLVQAQIRVAEGYKLSDPQTRVPSQKDLKLNGYAIQCRITTENPIKNFVPDYGRISTYRSAAGWGIRLDGGTAFTGALITPYYDSMLVKVTSFGREFLEAAARINRALSEFRIRGLSTNIPFLMNVLRHPTFLAGTCDTGFIEANPDLFTWKEPRDRANKLLSYLADVTVNGNPIVGEGLKAPALAKKPVAPTVPAVLFTDKPKKDEMMGYPGIRAGTKQIFEQYGAKGLADWARKQKRLLVTDTTFRDAHQSLFATRMRSYDMLAVADYYARECSGLFSMEMWGGATFDTSMRFLKEDPWERLARLREKVPNILFQMLVRGSSAVGYTNYPDNVVKEFIKESKAAGMDIFRIFDSLNWLPGLEVAMEAAIESGGICEAAICYTGDINDPKRDKYSLKYYVNLAKELVKRGTHILAIKDMAGLCKAYAAEKLVRALRNEVGVPVHFHTHDTGGVQPAAIVKASEANVDIADMAIASMSGNTSQPNLNSLVAILKDSPRATGLNLTALNKISDYFEGVRKFYYPFESDMKAGTAEVWEHEMPGGQYTNLQQQAASMGLEDKWELIKDQYRAVNFLFGDIVKVTPSSKIVGDMALFLVSNGVKAEDVIEKGKHISFPESVVQFFEGHIGFPPGGFDPKLQKVILKDKKPLKKRAGALLKPINLKSVAATLQEKYGPEAGLRDALSHALYGKVYDEFASSKKKYGDCMPLPTKNFLFGMENGEEIKVEIEEGKTLIVKLISVSEPGVDGTRKVYFELNGMPREATVKDKKVKGTAKERVKADPNNLAQVAATMPGLIAEIKVSKGSEVKKGDVLLVLEAMKMQVNIGAPKDGVIREVVVGKGDVVDAGDLMVAFE